MLKKTRIDLTEQPLLAAIDQIEIVNDNLSALNENEDNDDDYSNLKSLSNFFRYL